MPNIMEERAAAHRRYDGPLPREVRERLERLARRTRRDDLRADCRFWARVVLALRRGEDPPVLCTIGEAKARYRRIRGWIKEGERAARAVQEEADR